MFQPVQKGDSEWARSNLHNAVFRRYLKNVFKPHPPDTGSELFHNQIERKLATPFQMSRPIKSFPPVEIKKAMTDQLPVYKTAGYNLIAGNMFKCLL